MFCRKTKNRVCTSHNPQMVLFKTNIGITQPKPAVNLRTGATTSRRPLRSRFHNGVKTQLANFHMTTNIIPAYNTTLDKLYNSDGYGQPNSSNRKQKTFNTDKLEKNDKSTTPNLQQTSDQKLDANKQKYKNGFMYKSQANVEANVGSMDRLHRLKAVNIKKYANNSPLYLL